jgi:HEXXH motif-containing protein
MRRRLATSLRHVATQCAPHLPVDRAALEARLARVERSTVPPALFGAYYEAVFAIDAGELDAAQSLIGDIIAGPDAESALRIVALGDPAADPVAARIQRLVDTDPAAPLRLAPPDPQTARTFHDRVASALRLLDAGCPALAAEIRALVREIVLAAPAEPQATLQFDGASSFMLWGAVVLNARMPGSVIEMAQTLAHESAHNLLFGLCAEGSLVENADDERFASPLRVDPRPMDGIVHATFVTARMHYALHALAGSGSLDATDGAYASDTLPGLARAFDAGIATIEAHGRLTPLGTAVLDGARRYMAALPVHESSGPPPAPHS